MLTIYERVIVDKMKVPFKARCRFAAISMLSGHLNA